MIQSLYTFINIIIKIIIILIKQSIGHILPVNSLCVQYAMDYLRIINSLAYIFSQMQHLQFFK